MTKPSMNAEFSAMNERVTGLDGDVKELKSSFAGLSRKLEEGLLSISDKLDERNKTPIGHLSLVLSFCVVIGGMAYWPVREGQSDLKDTIRALSNSVVYKPRYDNNQQYIKEEFEKLRQEKASKETENARYGDLQRQIDDIKRR